MGLEREMTYEKCYEDSIYIWFTNKLGAFCLIRLMGSEGDHLYSFILQETSLQSRLPRWLGDKESACQCRSHRRCRFHSWVGKVPWRQKWQPTPVFLPGESPWTEEPGGLPSMGSQRVGHNLATKSAPPQPLGGRYKGKLSLE